MPNEVTNTELRVVSLFAKGNDRLMSKMPYRIVAASKELYHANEEVIGVPEEGKKVIMRQHHGKITGTDVLECGRYNRGFHEHFGNHYQIITSACIHNADKVVLLVLKEQPSHIDGFHAGTLTYPQGHVDFDNTFAKLAIGDNPNKFQMSSLIYKSKCDCIREISEEITIEDENIKNQFFNDIHYALFNESSIYPIYINHPGTTGRHICLLFDIDLTGTLFDHYAEDIISNEPDKHNVRIFTFSDLCNIDRADDIDPWVAASFSKVPFFGSTFIQSYLVPGAF